MDSLFWVYLLDYDIINDVDFKNVIDTLTQL